jgi:hypothetical protein
VPTSFGTSPKAEAVVDHPHVSAAGSAFLVEPGRCCLRSRLKLVGRFPSHSCTSGPQKRLVSGAARS